MNDPKTREDRINLIVLRLLVRDAIRAQDLRAPQENPND